MNCDELNSVECYIVHEYYCKMQMFTVMLEVGAKENHIWNCYFNPALLKPCCIIHKRTMNLLSLMEEIGAPETQYP